MIFLNGLPIFTAELKNQLTGQNVLDAIKQYKRDRLNLVQRFVHLFDERDEISALPPGVAGEVRQVLQPEPEQLWLFEE